MIAVSFQKPSFAAELKDMKRIVNSSGLLVKDWLLPNG
jgi:hypothetical protein